MELDEDTYFELSCQSSWDRWEFAVALHTMLAERREGIRERVAEHRKWNLRRKREAERAAYARLSAEQKEARNVARRAAAKAARDAAIARGEKTPEQLKWERRKASLRSVRDTVAAGYSPAKPICATVGTSGP